MNYRPTTQPICMFVLVIHDTSIANAINTGLIPPHQEYMFIIEGNRI